MASVPVFEPYFAQEGVQPVYAFVNGSILIEAAPAIVWDHACHFDRWQDYAAITTVHGASGNVGSVDLLEVLPTSAAPMPPYYARIILNRPEERIVWKTFPADGSNSFTGLVEMTLTLNSGGCTIGYDFLYELVLAGVSPVEAEKMRIDAELGFASLCNDIYPRLKALCEAPASAA